MDETRNSDGKFKKGHSGHPIGRPRKQPPAPARRQSCRDVVLEELTEPITVTVKGEQVDMQAFRATVRAQRNRALTGSTPAFKALVEAIKVFELRDVLFREPDLSPADLAFLDNLKKSMDEWARPIPGDRDYVAEQDSPDNEGRAATHDLDDDETIDMIDPITGKTVKPH